MINYRGVSAELFAAAWFVENGFVVHFPFGNTEAYDLLVERIGSGAYMRVQVKRAYERKGKLVVNLVHKDGIRYKCETIDWIVAVHPPTHRVWFLPDKATKHTRIVLQKEWVRNAY